ncbi:MFS transporter [Chloroflexota bacterium]
MVVRKRIFHGWVIVGIVFLTMFIGYAIRESFPLFYIPMLAEFGRSRAETALISSISFLVYGFASAVSGALLDKFGPKKTFTAGVLTVGIGLVGCSQATELWHIFIFWGVIFSLGMSAVGFVPCNAVVSRWFVRKRATALGVAQAGGRESFVFSPVTQALILAIGWRHTYLVFAAMAVITITILAQFLRRSPEEMGLLPDGGDKTDSREETHRGQRYRSIVNKEWAAKDWSLPMAIKKYRFWALFATTLGGAVAFGIVMAHQVAFMVDIGYSAMFASFLLLIFGFVGVAGRLCGFISDIIGRERSYTLACSGVIFGFLMLTLTKDTSTAWMLYTFIISFALFSGLSGPTMITAEADIFEGGHLGAIIGFLNIGFGMGNAIGSWLGGYIFDAFGSYVPAFITAMIMLALSSICMWVAAPRKIRAVQR